MNQSMVQKAPTKICWEEASVHIICIFALDSMQHTHVERGGKIDGFLSCHWISKIRSWRDPSYLMLDLSCTGAPHENSDIISTKVPSYCFQLVQCIKCPVGLKKLQPSIIHHQLSTTNHLSSTINYRSISTNHPKNVLKPRGDQMCRWWVIFECLFLSRTFAHAHTYVLASHTCNAYILP